VVFAPVISSPKQTTLTLALIFHHALVSEIQKQSSPGLPTHDFFGAVAFGSLFFATNLVLAPTDRS
jgi:hypothetical protein